jgi:hypothetical protein
MVWSQYVYEATVDLDSYGSGDDDDAHEHTPLNIQMNSHLCGTL